jgi:hypothetical protein
MPTKGFSHYTELAGESPHLCERSARHAMGDLREFAGVKKVKLF